MDQGLRDKYSFLEDKFFILDSVSKTAPDGTKTMQFECVQCTPQRKLFSATTLTLGNLKRHLDRSHPSSVVQYQELCKDRDRRKR